VPGTGVFPARLQIPIGFNRGGPDPYLSEAPGVDAKTYWGLGLPAEGLPPAPTDFERWIISSSKAYEKAVAESVEKHFQELVDFDPEQPP